MRGAKGTIVRERGRNDRAGADYSSGAVIDAVRGDEDYSRSASQSQLAYARVGR